MIREKTVLHILDGIKALYHGGPGIRNPQCVWKHKTMYFATDPVALDRAGWQVIDEKRKEVGMKSITGSKSNAHSTFLNRQPEHVEIAGALGLDEWDEKKVEIKRFNLA